MPNTSVNIKLVAIVPEKMNFSPIVAGMKKSVKIEMERQKALLELVSETWKEKDKPVWSIKVEQRPNEVVGTCTTDSTPFVFLELGTKSRKRRMQPGYGKRTRPRHLGSFAGAKEADGWFTRPVLGIPAGHWREEASKNRKDKFPNLVQRGISSLAQRLFRTGKGIEVG